MFPERPVHKPHTLTDFTDFEEVVGNEGTNLFVARLKGAANRHLLYPRYVICGSIRFGFCV